MTDRIRGVLAPVVTPFDHDLAPDTVRFVAQCRWLLSQQTGLAVFGTNSESNSLAADERMRLLDALVEAKLDTARMMPGTGTCSIPETVRLTAHAVRHGCAGVLMLPPFYYKGVSDEGLYRYFSEVIQRVGDDRLRIYLYHIPPVAVVGITPALVERLLKSYPAAVAGMKDSSADWSNTSTFLHAFAGAGFDVFAGSESFLLATLRHGGAGCISATANINPAAIARLAATWNDPTADAQQAALDVLRALMARQPNMIAALKAVVASFTNDPAWTTVRPPLVAMLPSAVDTMRADLDRLGFTMPGRKDE